MGSHGWGVCSRYNPSRHSRAVYETVRHEVETHGPFPSGRIIEWLMGWPDEWTALEPLQTARFRQWLDLHG